MKKIGNYVRIHGDKRVLIEKGENDINIMSVSLLEIKNGSVLSRFCIINFLQGF